MPTDTKVNDLKINVLSEAQYEQIQSPSTTELYLVPEVVDTTPTSGSTNPITSGGVYAALQNIPAQEQSDWNETDTTDPAFIKNKPQNIVTDANYVHTDNNYTTTEKSKLADIEAGAEANVQSDWNQTNSSADDFIKNKPTIPATIEDLNDTDIYLPDDYDTLVYSELHQCWENSALNIVAFTGNYNQLNNKPNLATVATSGDYDDLTNKPTIPAAQVNSDWNATSGVAQILNKPTIPDVLEELSDVKYEWEAKYIPNALTDYDGNSYGAVILGDQVWMAENLRTTHYADGTAVTYKDMTSSQFTLRERGLFYNWPAIMNGASSSNSIPSGVQGVAPTGWHVPSKNEFIKLNNYLQTRPDYWVGVPQNTAKSMASKYGWEESTREYAVGNDQLQNNNSSLNLIPAGSFQNNTVYGLGYAIISNTTEAGGSATYVNPFILGAVSVSPGLTALYAKEVYYLSVRCLYNGTPEQFIKMLMDKQVLIYDYSKQAWVNKNVAEALPSMNGNSGKVLAVNGTETDVEWVRPVTVYSGSSEPSTSLGEDGDIFILAS